jgi:hypothetical protein
MEFAVFPHIDALLLHVPSVLSVSICLLNQEESPIMFEQNYLEISSVFKESCLEMRSIHTRQMKFLNICTYTTDISDTMAKFGHEVLEFFFLFLTIVLEVHACTGFPEPVETGPVRPVPGPTGPARFEKWSGTGP